MDNASNQSPIDLSVVIPAFNERFRLPSTLLEMTAYLERVANRSYELIVVDDGSSDDTAEVVERLKSVCPKLSIVSLGQNRGKGCAVRTGILAARGEHILFADADGATPFQEVAKLQAAIATGADIAIGSRAMHSKDTKVVTNILRKSMGRTFNFLVNSLLIPGIADTQCGFKLFRRAAARFIFSRQLCDGFGFDVEVLHIAHKVGMKTVEVPINWVNVPGSKVRLISDSLLMFRDLLVFKLRHRGISANSYKENPFS